MSFNGIDQDKQLLAAPYLEAAQLSEIAGRRPDLWAQIQAHPSSYPELNAWIAERTPAPTWPTPVPVPAGNAAKKNKKVLWIALTAVAALVLGVGAGGGVWLLLGRKSGEDPGTAYASLPVLTSAAAIGRADAPIALIPLGNSGHFSEGTTLVAAADVEGRELLVGLEKGNIGAPAWTATLSSPLSQCELQGSAVRCGDEQVSVTTGEVSLAQGTQTSTENEGEGATETGEDDTERSEESQARLTPTAPGGDGPYLEGHMLLNKKGEPLATFSFTPVWQQDNGGGTTLFTDGSKVVAVKGNKLLWATDLEVGSEEVNGVGGEPPFGVDGGTVVIGEPSGIVGIDTKTGEKIWRLEATVDAWLLSDQTLLLGAEGAIYELEFPTEPQEEQVGAEGLTKLDVPRALSYEDLANMTLAVPAGCSRTVGAQGAPLEFRDGRTDGQYNFAIIDTVEPLLAGDGAFALAQITCSSGDDDSSSQYWAIYNEEANLVAGESMYQVPGFGYYQVPFNDYQETLSASHSQFSYTLEAVELMTGYTDLTVTQEFDGSEVSVVDVVFHLLGGDMRAPKLEEVQALYDQVAARNEDAVADQISVEELRSIKEGMLGDDFAGGPNYARILYPQGGKVNNCVLAAATYHKGQMVTDDLGVGFLATDKDYIASRFEPGVWLCGVQPPAEGGGVRDVMNWGDGPIYEMGLRVLTDADGTPFLVGTERTFS